MASGSTKKRHRRTTLQHSSSPSMASSSSSLTSTRRSTLLVVSLIICVVVITLYITPSPVKKKTSLEEDRALSSIISSIEVVREFPHDPHAFTQGLLYGGNDTLFESTGLYGHSSVRKVVLQTGKVEILQGMDNSYFAEGLTLLGDRLFQLTWLKRVGFVYDRHNLSKSLWWDARNANIVCTYVNGSGRMNFFLLHSYSWHNFNTQLSWMVVSSKGKVLFMIDVIPKSRTFSIEFEKFTHQMRDGWGLATDGEVLFGTDGSSTLYKLNSKTLKVIEKAIVKYKDYEVQNLNELEYVNGEVWANVWSTDCIARISPKDGMVLGWILLPDLRKQLLQAGNIDIDVLNGIAWDSEKNRIFVTGKQWPKLYEIKLHPIRNLVPGSIEQLCLRRRAFDFAEP